ncbi:probable peptidyl-tRNA hydrolase isoform X2 [Xenopus laevis]|uniref:Peptidyl-tRNA hydrolase n=2 Tax=Xenopus laevis TaxID=8355 RepID=A0A974H0K3_XENLA|nr:probable peptidyl-tRNA hydrolase isoform X2 [Xenopus laevis]OCT60394.1 hypothetical protein XELAEV_18046413mg [Xenopus laevis]
MLSLKSLCALRLGRCLSNVASKNLEGQRLMVVGLGNYIMAGTRHSIGMAVVNQLARRLNISDRWKADKKTGADLTDTDIDGMHIVLMKPRQFMNLNGKSVANAATKFQLKPENIYLLHDELDKPLGKVSLKFGGSDRGHKGVRSCITSLQSNIMTRLLVGIGRPADRSSVEWHVLGRFTKAEQDLLPDILERSVDLVLSHIKQNTGSEPSRKPATSQDPIKS